MVNFRAAQPTDSPAIARLHTAAVSGIRTTLYTPEEIQSWAIPKDPARYEESILSREFLVAEDDGVLLGFGVLNLESAVVEAVYVSPEAGGRGIGLAILQKLEDKARSIGLKVVELNASLNAVPFYQRAGYLAREASKYRLATGVEIACVPMWKRLVHDENSD